MSSKIKQVASKIFCLQDAGTKHGSDWKQGNSEHRKTWLRRVSGMVAGAEFLFIDNKTWLEIQTRKI